MENTRSNYTPAKNTRSNYTSAKKLSYFNHPVLENAETQTEFPPNQENIQDTTRVSSLSVKTLPIIPPKLNRSAYVLFCMEMDKVIRENASIKSAQEAFNIKGSYWESMSPNEKVYLEDMAEKEKEAYQEEKSLRFFIYIRFWF